MRRSTYRTARTRSPSSRMPSLTTRPALPDINDSIVSATITKGSAAAMISRRRRAASIR